MIFHRQGNRELFNLDSDIGETKDVSDEHADVAKRMTTLMQSYIDRGRSTPGPAQKNEFDLSLSFGKNRKEK